MSLRVGCDLSMSRLNPWSIACLQLGSGAGALRRSDDL